MKPLAGLLAVFMCAVLSYIAIIGPGRPYLKAAKLSVEHRAFVSKLQVQTNLSEHFIEMADGIHLATDVYLPRDGAPKKPTILVRLPYGKRYYSEALHWVELFSAQDYVVVVQDMRGRFRSEGVFSPYPNEGADGAATLDWIVSQPWATDRVGTIGCSALGEAQLFLAAERHPAHRAMIPMGAGGAIGTANDAYGFFGFFEGGIMTLASSFGWFQAYGGKTGEHMHIPPVNYAKALKTLPVIDAVSKFREDDTDYEELLQGFDDPNSHKTWGYISNDDVFDVPSLMVDTWYDYGIRYSLDLNERLAKATQPSHMLITPGTHCDFEGAFSYGFVGDVPVSKTAGLDFDAHYVRFMDHFLKDGPPVQVPPFQTYMLQEDAWLKTKQWPPAAAQKTRIFLDGAYLGRKKSNATTHRKFTSDPTNPIPTLGGAICCTGDPNSRSGPLHQNGIETRQDVLLYTTSQLEAPLRIAGPLLARLFVSTNVPDTDLIVRVTDVDPDGISTMIQEGALRLRYRDGYEKPALMTAGKTYAVNISLRDIAYKVAKGHMLRIHIAGSSFPRLARNMNTGGDPNIESKPQLAHITIYDGPETQSHIELFVLPN